MWRSLLFTAAGCSLCVAILAQATQPAGQAPAARESTRQVSFDEFSRDRMYPMPQDRHDRVAILAQDTGARPPERDLAPTAIAIRPLPATEPQFGYSDHADRLSQRAR